MSLRQASRRLCLQTSGRRYLSITSRSLASSNDDTLAKELGVGEMEGVKLKIEPLRRVGEDANTMRARLLYQSRKRGTLESDLMMSTFADANLPTMTVEQMQQYDLFLDENDWDIYYWATQEPPAEGEMLLEDAKVPGQPRAGEWAQTVGTFKPAYRPVPIRWKDSEILSLIREHVRSRSAGGADGSSTAGKGMAFMPKVRNMDQ